MRRGAAVDLKEPDRKSAEGQVKYILKNKENDVYKQLGRVIFQ